MSTRTPLRPYDPGGVFEYKGREYAWDILEDEVSRCKLDPSLKAPRFQTSNPETAYVAAFKPESIQLFPSLLAAPL